MDYKHIPIMFDQVMEGLNINPGGVYFDLTVGGAGHSEGIAKRLENGKLFCLDRDPDAVKTAKQRLSQYSNVLVIQSVYNNIDIISKENDVDKVDGILMDLGVSSFQLDTCERGFSYLHNGPLDMRMGKEGMTAAQLISSVEHKELTRILRYYGDERFAANIARGILQENKKSPITTTEQLAKIVANNVPAKFKKEKNPCKRTFQALRIAVNDEINILDETIKKCFDLLNKSGRMAIITFHSIEDKLVQSHFKSWVKGCICPREFPICVCGNVPKAKYISRLILPSEQEQENNRRSKSAKLRIIERI